MYIFFIVFNIIILISMAVFSNLIYAQAILHDETLSEITKHTSPTKGPQITVGGGPWDIKIDPDEALGYNSVTNKAYVVNHDDNTVSVIDTMNNTKVGDDIKVGKVPYTTAIELNKAYVVNQFDNSLCN
jgi:YVTN family beta-propeller protein